MKEKDRETVLKENLTSSLMYGVTFFLIFLLFSLVFFGVDMFILLFIIILLCFMIVYSYYRYINLKALLEWVE